MKKSHAYVPFEIQVEILKKIPVVKSLIRFTSVSKQWKSLIDSSEFIADHSVNQTQPHHLMVSYTLPSRELKYVSIVDDDSFAVHKFSPVVPPTIKLVGQVSMMDCSHGLVCLYDHAPDLKPRKKSVVIWNPSIRKSVGIVLPHEFNGLVGFGVCRETCDPKVVTITQQTSVIHSVDWKVEVFTLSSRAWRSISVNLHMPGNLVICGYSQAVIDGVIHWVADDRLTRRSESIVSFDLTSEEFGEVHFPDSLAYCRDISISKLKESLALLDYKYCKEVCSVWMMTKTGDLKYSFAKLFTFGFQAFDGCNRSDIHGFTKDGQPIMEYRHRFKSFDSIVTTLEAWEPYTKRKSHHAILVGPETFFKMSSYTESLLLLNHSDSIIR